MKKLFLLSLDKEIFEIFKSKDREINVNISESKQNLGNSDDEDLKRVNSDDEDLKYVFELSL